MGRTTRILDRSPPAALVAAAAIATTVVVAVGDYVTGPYLVFAAFYFLPVMAAAWYIGVRAGAAAALAAALAGAASTALDPGEVTGSVIAWNAVARTTTYGVLAWLVHVVREAMSNVHALAATDPLTGLANRRRFLEVLDAEVARARRDGTWLSVAYLDLDGLKERNDAAGHEAGDMLLSTFARVSAASVRVTDTLGRLGGDEFCILMPGADRPSAEIAMRRLFDDFAGADPPVSASAGVVSAQPTPDVSPSAIVAAADALMLEAKRSGKRRFLTMDLRPETPLSAET